MLPLMLYISPEESTYKKLKMFFYFLNNSDIEIFILSFTVFPMLLVPDFIGEMGVWGRMPKSMTSSCVQTGIKNRLFNKFRNKQSLILKLYELRNYYIRKTFIEKYFENMQHYLIRNLFLILVKNSKCRLCI